MKRNPLNAMWIALKPLRMLRTLVAVLTAALATPAAAETETRLVDCGAGSCLLVTGHRADAVSGVSINGHTVPVEGGRRWRVRVPVETLREWSAPFARSITVAVADAESQAVLPIGMLGHVENLTFLTVSVK